MLWSTSKVGNFAVFFTGWLRISSTFLCLSISWSTFCRNPSPKHNCMQTLPLTRWCFVFCCGFHRKGKITGGSRRAQIEGDHSTLFPLIRMLSLTTVWFSFQKPNSIHALLIDSSPFFIAVFWSLGKVVGSIQKPSVKRGISGPERRTHQLKSAPRGDSSSEDLFCSRSPSLVILARRLNEQFGPAVRLQRKLFRISDGNFGYQHRRPITLGRSTWLLETSPWCSQDSLCYYVEHFFFPQKWVSWINNK